MIEASQIVLPRFQRHEAWRRPQIVGLLENVLRDPPLPIGALLILEIGDKEPFISRPIVTAPPVSGRPQMHLLDGQQRMTALYRSLTGTYEDLDIFVSLNPSEEPAEEADPASDIPCVQPEKRWKRKDVPQPVWADNPAETYKRNLIPITALCPGSIGEKNLKVWSGAIKKSGGDPSDAMPRIYQLRQRVATFMIPFLSLGVRTDRETALDVFIRMNTSASPLRDFDIVVAQIEESTGESLHHMVQELLEEEPTGREYGKIEDIILSIAALIIGKPPLKKTYLEKSFAEGFVEAWPNVKHGFKKGLTFLREEAIFKEKILPTDVGTYLVCALWAGVPENGLDAEGNARSLIRKVFWRACYTERYSQTSATRAFADYKALNRMISDPSASGHCALFEENLPEPDELVRAGWPGRKDRLPRAILATTLRAGGRDFADGAPINQNNFDRREYHHIYPVDVLGGDRKDKRVNRALNCAYITWTTNRKVGAKTPKEYIDKRTKQAKLGETEVRQRLESHLIPYDSLIAGDYDSFLKARAEEVSKHMKDLCNGVIPSGC